MLVVPRVLDEVISVMPAMCPNCLSNGVAIAEAMMSGLPPGNEAATVIVGKSTCGRGDTGSTVKAAIPTRATATVSRVVATGRPIKRLDGFMQPRPPPAYSRLPRDGDARISRPTCQRRYR